MVLSNKQLAEIEQRANAATPGPLGARLGSGMNVCTALASESSVTFDEFVCDTLPEYVCLPGLAKRWEANRVFIQHAYTDIPALCDTVKHLRAEIRRLTKERDQAREDVRILTKGRFIQS